MEQSMTIEEFVTNCLKYGLTFEIIYYERDAYDEYCLHMILGNHEHIIPCNDRYKLARLWYEDIVEYYID